MPSEDKQQSVFVENLGYFLESDDQGDQVVNVVDGLFAIAESLKSVAGALRDLGNGNAATQFGAIEALSIQIKEGLDGIASSVDARE